VSAPSSPLARLLRLIRAELRKLTTVRSTYVMVAISAAAAALLGMAIALAPHRQGAEALLFAPSGTALWYDTVFSALTIAQDLALVLGILVITGEYRHRTATATFLAEPSRSIVTGAKLLVSALSGLVLALAACLGALALGAGLVAGGYGTASTMLHELGSFVPGIIGASVLFAVYGLGLGALLRNQVAALVVGLGVTTIVEPIIQLVLPSVGRWLPSQAARALEPEAASSTSGGFAGLTHHVSSLEGALALLGYGVVLAIAGSLTTLRADIS
jgi:hypothetical protein